MHKCKLLFLLHFFLIGDSLLPSYINTINGAKRP